MKRRIVILVLAALALGACRRLVVLEPLPDSNTLPDAVDHQDGGFGDAGPDGNFGDGGGVQDAGTIGDAAHD